MIHINGKLGTQNRWEAYVVWEEMHGRTVISMPPTREAAATEVEMERRAA